MKLDAFSLFESSRTKLRPYWRYTQVSLHHLFTSRKQTALTRVARIDSFLTIISTRDVSLVETRAEEIREIEEKVPQAKYFARAFRILCTSRFYFARWRVFRTIVVPNQREDEISLPLIIVSLYRQG